MSKSLLWFSVMAGLFLAAVFPLIAGPSSGGHGVPYAVTNRGGRLTVNVRDCPLGEWLTAFCGQIQAELYLDPRLTDQVSVSFENQDAEQALFQALKPYDYVITWEKGAVAGGRREDRIASVRVFRDGQPEETVWMRAFDRDDTEPEILFLAARLADKNDPEGASQAAETLARNGTPVAVRPLFSALSAWNEDGTMTDAVSRAALAVTNRNAASGLLLEYLAAADETVELASRFALSRMADPSVIKLIADSYAASNDGEVREKLVTLIGSISSPDAEGELIRLAGAPDLVAERPVSRAALRALGNMGTATATDHLLEHLEKGRRDEREEVAEIVRNVVASPRSAAALRYAALGNKRYVSELTRLAAIRGLARFRDEQTLAALNTLAVDPNAAICAMARRTIEVEVGTQESE